MFYPRNACIYVNMTTKGGVNISKTDDNKLEQGGPTPIDGGQEIQVGTFTFFLIYSRHFFLL